MSPLAFRFNFYLKYPTKLIWSSIFLWIQKFSLFSNVSENSWKGRRCPEMPLSPVTSCFQLLVQVSLGVIWLLNSLFSLGLQPTWCALPRCGAGLALQHVPGLVLICAVHHSSLKDFCEWGGVEKRHQRGALLLRVRGHCELGSRYSFPRAHYRDLVGSLWSLFGSHITGVWLFASLFSFLPLS